MVPTEYLFVPDDIASIADWHKPVAFIDLAAWPADLVPASLPPFPVIGFGDRRHPVGRLLDACVEPPVSTQGLIREISAHPHASAVAVQLLRVIDETSVASALVLESFAYGLLQGSGEHAAWLDRQAATVPAAAPGVTTIERLGDGLDVLVDRPAARNAIDRSIRDGLFEAFTIACVDQEVRRIRLRSRGPVFSIGADLAEFGTTRDPATAHLIRSRTLPAHALAGCAAKLDVHVQGACIGAGLEIAAFAGRLTAAPDAWFQLPELSMGLIPGAGGCVSVSRRVGRQRAALMILSGRRVSARVALDWGLIDAIEDDPAVNDRRADEFGGKS